MKNKIISLIILTVLIISSCSLEEFPYGKITPEQFFQNKTEVDQFMQGAYLPINNYDFYGMSWWNRAEAINDQVTCRSDLRLSFVYDQPGDGYPLLWKYLYQGINSANMLINRVGLSPNLNDELKKSYIAEARFLRGFYYFHAMVGYGKVPLILEDTPSEEALTMGRTDTTIVWNQIIADMSFAAENCVDNFGNLKSRANKWSVQAILSRMYLYRHHFSKAAASAKKVMDSGKYDLMSNFADVWLESNEQGKEVIFSVEFFPNVYASSRAAFFTARSDKEPSSTPGVTWNGWGSNAVGSRLPGMFEPGDLRKDQTVVETNWLDGNKPFATNKWNFGPKFWDFKNAKGASAKDFLIIRYAEVLLNYAEAENEASGPTTNAYMALNKVRARAGLSPVSGLTKVTFRDQVRHERAVELAGEGQRKWDLVRWGIWLSTMKGLDDVDLIKLGRDNISERFELFPIPPVEIAKNPNLLPNNPGY